MTEINKTGWRGILVLLLLLASVVEFSARGPFRLFYGGMGWNDFLSPFIQAKAWAHGQDPYSTQSLVAWWPPDNPRPPFVDSDVAAGKIEMKRGMPSPYPLPSLVLLSLFTVFPWPAAVSLWTVISLVGVILAAFALLSACECRLYEVRSRLFLAAFFALAPLHTGLATANPAMVSVALAVGAFWAAHANREKTAGVLLALAICLKPTVAGGLLLYYLLRRGWAVVATACAVAAAIFFVGWVRLTVAGVAWIPSYLENGRKMFAAGSVDDFTRASALRFNMINAQVFFGGFLRSPLTARFLAYLLGVALLGCWIWLCYRRRTSSSLLDVSAISILSLIAVYHRFYDAALLIFPLAWSALVIGKRAKAIVIFVMISPFFVPGPILLAYFAQSGRIPDAITRSWGWNAVILPHEVWDLILMAILLLLFMRQEFMGQEFTEQGPPPSLSAS
jgi:glycosyl transferase family 87